MRLTIKAILFIIGFAVLVVGLAIGIIRAKQKAWLTSMKGATHDLSIEMIKVEDIPEKSGYRILLEAIEIFERDVDPDFRDYPEYESYDDGDLEILKSPVLRDLFLSADNSINKLKEIRNIEHFHVPTVDSITSDLNNYLTGARKIAWFSSENLVFLAEDKNWNDFIEVYEANLYMALLIEQGGPLINKLVAIAIDDLLIRAIIPTIFHYEPPDEVLLELLRITIKFKRSKVDLAESLKYDYAMFENQNHSFDLSELLLLDSFYYDPPLWIREPIVRRLVGESENKTKENIKEYYKQLITLVKRKSLGDAAMHDNNIHKSKGWLRGDYESLSFKDPVSHWLIREMIARIHRPMETVLDSKINKSFLNLSILIELFRRQKGRLPNDFEEIPYEKYSIDISDHFSKDQLRYEKLNDSSYLIRTSWRDRIFSDELPKKEDMEIYHKKIGKAVITRLKDAKDRVLIYDPKGTIKSKQN